MSSNYWSSTTNANNTNNAWNINFNNGNDNWNNKSNNNYVRAVRGGECSLLSFKSVYEAYMDCRKRKRGTINAIRFEANLIDNLFDLALDLQKGRYLPSRSVCFITRSPKLREIFAADFRDRIVHHLLVRELEKIWEPRFIYDSYASRKGKGIHSAVDRLQGFMRKVTRNGKRAGYFIQLDIRSFFMSIDKKILFEIFDADPRTPKVLRELLSVIIFHDPTGNYYFKGDIDVLERIPPHKSLFHVGPDKGLPIGNLTSQFFSNIYLNELDQFVKHLLRCRFYLRYVDDFILISEDPEELVEFRDKISMFLENRLSLCVKADSSVKRVSDGADFLGYIIRPAYRLVRRRVVNNLKYRLAQVHEQMVSECVPGIKTDKRGGKSDTGIREKAVLPENMPVIRRLIAKPDDVYRLRQILASYLGHFKHSDSHRLVKAIFAKNLWIMQLFDFRNGRIYVKTAPMTLFPNMRAQVRFFCSNLPGFVCFFKVGKYAEVYDTDAIILQKIISLKPLLGHRGMSYAAGFPLHMLGGIRKRLLIKGFKTAVLAEGETGGRVKARYAFDLAVRVRQ
ncbi:MAG: hypothetical protein JXA35_07260 [Deltaproteobacteria bacterium]|nr:hypothetical protein [Deltaproteobacteria bacterium]